MLKIILIFALWSNIKTEETIDFSNDNLANGNGFKVTENSVTIESSGTYILKGTSFSKALIISQSVSATLKSNDDDFEIHFTKNYDLTAIIIGKNSQLTFVGSFMIQDYSEKKMKRML